MANKPTPADVDKAYHEMLHESLRGGGILRHSHPERLEGEAEETAIKDSIIAMLIYAQDAGHDPFQIMDAVSHDFQVRCGLCTWCGENDRTWLEPEPWDWKECPAVELLTGKLGPHQFRPGSVISDANIEAAYKAGVPRAKSRAN